MIFTFVQPSGNDAAEVYAFPAVLAEDVKNAIQLLVPNRMHTPSEETITVCLAGELLNIPYRVYYDKQHLLKNTESPCGIAPIVLCLGTRHHDGFVREQCLRSLLTVDEPWIAPFVVQLLGEYLIEAIQPIHERFLDGVERKYVDFFVENARHCEYLEQRAISYWNEYYRPRFPKHKDYPAVKAFAALKGRSRSGAMARTVNPP